MKFYRVGITVLLYLLLNTYINSAFAQDVVQGPSDAFGNAYAEEPSDQVNIEFDLGPDIEPTPANYLQTVLLRDVTISFKAKSGDVLALENGVKVSINGVQTLVSNLFTGEQSFSTTVNRNALIAGTNTITLEPINTNAGAIWGVTEITTSYIPVVDVELNNEDTQQYGYLENPSRYTGARLNFKAATIRENYTLQVRGWDIDRADESQVFLNGISLGFLSIGPNDDFNEGDQFVLPKDEILPGSNHIEFVQRVPDEEWEGLEFEQWAISNIIIKQLEADLLPKNFSIAEEKIAANIPFKTLTSVQNLGTATSSGAVLRFYTSTDSSISRSDSFVIARSIPPIAPGATVTFEKTMQTPLVDQGAYLGVCVSVIGFESDESNNCSIGLSLDNEKVINLSGVLLLLMDDVQ